MNGSTFRYFADRVAGTLLNFAQEAQGATQTATQDSAQNAATNAVQQATPDSSGGLAELANSLQETSDKVLQGKWSEIFADGLVHLQDAWALALPRLVSALVVLILFYGLYRLLATLLNRLLTRSPRVEDSLQHLSMRTFRVVGVAFILVTVLGQFGINVSALLAGLSIAGLAVGLAAKDTLENYISGITIFVDKPFRIGDSIEIEGVYGFVEHISMRSTRIRTRNNEMLVMPNVMMINQKLLNHTMHGTLRVPVPFGIAYKEFPQAAREVVLKCTEGDERLSDQIPPSVAVIQLNNSSVDMVLYLFLKDPAMEYPVLQDYTERIREALRAANIEIPFPHMQLFIDEAKAFDKRESGASGPVLPGLNPED